MIRGAWRGNAYTDVDYLCPGETGHAWYFWDGQSRSWSYARQGLQVECAEDGKYYTKCDDMEIITRRHYVFRIRATMPVIR